MSETTKPAALKKPNIFAKSKDKIAGTPVASKKKETLWQLGAADVSPPATLEELDEAVSKVIELSGKAKVMETEANMYKAPLKEYAFQQYVKALVRTGVEPPSPLKVVNSQKQSLTYVVQDRGHLSKVTDDQVEALNEL